MAKIDADDSSKWLVQHRDLLPACGDALDVACGRGRNALWLAARGLRVRALDRDARALEQVRRDAQRAGLHVSAELVDLEQPGVSLGRDAFDVIVATHYLHRPLFPALLEALRPDGLLIYETFTLAQAARGHPTNPDFLLRPGELRALVAPLAVIDYREGTYDGRDVAGIVAQRAPGQV
jgi:SAM-dependent methyltransferase